jgi:hypothetical protein
MTNRNLEAAINAYGRTAMAASKEKKSKAKLLGFGAAAAGGLFTAGQAEAAIVYSGVINAGFNISTVNLSSTNAISPPLIFNSTGGAIAFGIAGNDRGPANPVGSTDIVWAVGAGYIGGFGGVFASPAASFPTTVLNLPSSTLVGAAGTAASLAWAAVGLPAAPMTIDPFGAAAGTGTGFFGFTFQATSLAAPQFGWARISITSDGVLPTSATLVDWAYDNTGAPIHVGTVPAPGALALLGLAAGAAGIRRRRLAA